MATLDCRTLCDFHTHTSFCDGKDTPRALAERAYSLGFSSLGFSGHSYFFLDGDCTMTPDGEAEYRRQVDELRREYSGRMNIFLGIEADMYSDASKYSYDYKIGSLHYVKRGGEYIAVDYSDERLKEDLIKYYGGDFLSFAEDYYSQLCSVIKLTDADIIGHLDLITKFSERMPLMLDGRYFAYAKEAIDALIPAERPFEINTGAMARGYRTTPYPHITLLSHIRERGGRIILSSDCHNKDYLGYGFDRARELALAAGFSSRVILTDTGFSEIAL